MSALRTSLSACALMLATSSAIAINAEYRKQLERSGCTQVSEMQGCDIRKSKPENAKAGFGTAPQAAASAPAAANPYAGQWVAKNDSNGQTVATIRIDARERVWVSSKPVKAKRSDGGLTFKSGFLTFMIQGDRRLKGEDYWTDSDAGTRGKVHPE